MRDRIFYSICFGFVLGVLFRSFILADLYFIAFLGVLFLSLFLFFTFVSKYRWGIVTCIFILAFSLGIFRFHVVAVSAPAILESQVGQKVSTSGVIVDEPSITENNQKLTVRVDGLEVKILVSARLDEEYTYGELITLSGTLNKPENFITDQGKEFDYVNYLRKDGVFYTMSYPQTEVISRGHGNPVKSALFTAKNVFLNKINLSIPHPESLLLGGLILGERSSFGEEMRQKFIDTGTIHIVALSGYNVTIVAEWIMKMFSFLPRNFAFGAGIIGILLFVIMAGGQATAVRAGTMAVLALIARATGRTHDVARALVLAGAIMILSNPFVLAHDVSFQLSFIATIAVIFFVPKIEKYFLWVTPRFKLRDVVSVTFAAYIFVLPFILYKMGNLSLVALPANVLILPSIPITMVFGFLTGFAGVVSHFFAAPFGMISYLFLHYQLWVIDLFARLPFASFTIPNFPFFLVLIIYGYFIYKLFGRNIKNFFTGWAGE
ncbi:MAG: ComEC/Rec2 family competence protein [Candidatus Paceibacterota bacterium]